MRCLCSATVLLWLAKPMEAPTGPIKILGTGAESPVHVMEKWTFLYAAYRSKTHGVTLEFHYKAINSGTGRCNIMRTCLSERKIVFAGSDLPLKPEEREQYPELEMFPILGAPLTIVYNIPGYQLNLTREMFVDILSAKIKQWDDAAILRHNPGLRSTSLGPIKFIGRLGYAGETGMISAFASKVSSEWKRKYGVFSDPSIDPNTGKSRKWPDQLNIKFAESVATSLALVSNEKFTISYIGRGESINTGIQIASIRNIRGDWIEQGKIKEGITKAMAAVSLSDDLEADLVDVNADGAYPFSTYSYHIVNRTTASDVPCRSAAEFFRFIVRALSNEEMMSEVEKFGLVPLPGSVRDTVIKRIYDRITCQGKRIRSIIQATIEEESQKKFLEDFNKYITIAVIFGAFILLGTAAFSYHVLSKRRQVKKTFYLESLQLEVDTKQENETGTIFDHRSGRYKKEPVSCSAIIYNSLRDKEFEYKTLYQGCHYVTDIQHDNVQNILGFTTVQSRTFVVTDKVSGDRNLRTILQTAGTYLDSDARMALLQQVARGLEFLHSKDIVHGFLCPSTCLVDGNYTVKLSGWIHIPFLRLQGIELPAIKQIEDKIKKLEGTAMAPIDMDLLHFMDMDVFRHQAFSRTHDVYSFSILAAVMFSKKPIDELLKHRSAAGLPAIELFNDEHTKGFPRSLKSVCEAVVDGFPANRPTMSKINELMFSAKVFKQEAIVDILIVKLENHVLELQHKVDAKTVETDTATKKATELLEKMLPKTISAELASGVAVEPEVYKDAAVLAAEIVGFSTFCETGAPSQAVEMITRAHVAFEAICRSFDVPYTDFPGEYFMAASGVLHADFSAHVLKIGRAGTAVLARVQATLVSMTSKLDSPTVGVRVGGSMGTVIGGISGAKGPRYCLFGDTVDEALKMMRSSKPGKFQVTTAFVNRSKERHVKEFEFSESQVAMDKKSIKMDLPIIVAVFVYNYAKMNMLRFVYDFLRKYLRPGSYQMVCSDTDSIIAAYESCNLDDLVKPEMLEEYHRVGKPAFMAHDAYTKRTPGLYKEELKATGIVSLCSKTYFAWNDDDDSTKTSSKGLSKRTNKYTKHDFLRILETKVKGSGVNYGFRMVGNTLCQYQQERDGLAYLYVKRQVEDNGISTRALHL